MATKSIIVRKSSQEPELTRSRLAARSSILHGRENDNAIRAVPVIKRMRPGIITITAPGVTGSTRSVWLRFQGLSTHCRLLRNSWLDDRISLYPAFGPLVRLFRPSYLESVGVEVEKVNTMLKLFHERWGSTFSGTTQEPDNLRCPQAPDLLANLFSIDSLHSHSYRIGWNGDICRRER